MATQGQAQPQELLQAQVAAYAAAEITDREDHEVLLRSVGAGALMLADVVTRDVPIVGVGHISNDTENIPDQTEQRVITSNQEFTDWLRTDGNEHGRPVQARLELIRQYNQKFKEPVTALRDRVIQLPDPSEDPDHLGVGSSSRAFVLHLNDGDYAVRLPRYLDVKTTNPLIANETVDTMDLVKGIPGVEQLVAISIEDGVTVSELLPGKDGAQLFGEDLAKVQPQQLSKLLDTLEALHERGIRIDSKQSNFLYDPRKGFSIVDISVEKHAPGSRTYQSLRQKVEAAWSLLNTSGFVNDMAVRADSAEEFSFLGRDEQDRIPALDEFYKICATRYPDEVELLAKIKPDVMARNKRIAERLDPGWFESMKEYQLSALGKGQIQGDDSDWL